MSASGQSWEFLSSTPSKIDRSPGSFWRAPRWAQCWPWPSVRRSAADSAHCARDAKNAHFHPDANPVIHFNSSLCAGHGSWTLCRDMPLHPSAADLRTTSSPQPSLLVVDDEQPVLNLIQKVAQNAGYHVTTCSNGSDALRQLARKPADLAMVDLRMPDVNGLDLLRDIRRAVPGCEVILMTGHGGVDSAVEAIKRGAREYLTKPFDFVRLGKALADVRTELARRAQIAALEGAVARELEFCGMIGRSP